jgi:hypothetical protein
MNFKPITPILFAFLALSFVSPAKAQSDPTVENIVQASNGNFIVNLSNGCEAEFTSAAKFVRSQKCDDVDAIIAENGLTSHLENTRSHSSPSSSNLSPNDACKNAVSSQYGQPASQIQIKTVGYVMNWKLPNGTTGSCVFKDDGSVVIPMG